MYVLHIAVIVEPQGATQIFEAHLVPDELFSPLTLILSITAEGVSCLDPINLGMLCGLVRIVFRLPFGS